MCAVRWVVAVLLTEFLQSCRLETVASMHRELYRADSWAIAMPLTGRCVRTEPGQSQGHPQAGLIWPGGQQAWLDRRAASLAGGMAMGLFELYVT